MKDKYFTNKHLIKDKSKYSISETGNYSLDVTWYTTGKGCWNYSRGIVKDVKTGNIIADVKRNYSSFWFEWVKHENGNEYLLCGENYQGYTCINLTQEKRYDYLPEEAKEGVGFCWTNAKNCGNELVVEGCIWACPFEEVIYDFSNPDVIPYKEINRKYLDEDEDYEDDIDYSGETD
jgi:hypothetical protein